ncbi:hypothetical protein F5Y19DRAFT_452880 [Xylariaceae sp. FL1651]|nr:hypothetical protein F5Y19DRAFT_452880 [Xylariaceae sp. FL1651]
MHHMTDFERLIASDENYTELEHVQVLLEFLRPRYQQYYIPATKRYLSVQPTVTFDDVWVLMKPGSLAYAHWDGQTIGCVIGKSIHLPPIPSRDIPEQWSIQFWFLQVHWHSDQIGCTTLYAAVDRFDGEEPVTSLPIYPAEFLDANDQERTKQRFIERGRKVCDILWGESMYMEYDGECMDNFRQSYTGRIIVGGSDETEELYPPHDWKFSWVSPSQLMKKDPDVPLSEIEFMVNPKKDHRDLLTRDHLFILSPCLSAFRLSNNDWVPITVESIRPLTKYRDIPSPIIDEDKIEMVQKLVKFQYREEATQFSQSRTKGNGLVIHIHGPPGVGKSSFIEFTSLRSRRPVLELGLVDLGTHPNGIRTNIARWLSISKRLNAMLLIDKCDEIMLKETPQAGSAIMAFIQALRLSNGVIFLTTSRMEAINDVFHPLISLTVSLPELDSRTRSLIWLGLETTLNAKKGIQLHQSAKKFLGSSEARIVNWDGHEITRCFKIAIALAAKHRKRSQESAFVVDDGHFKEAMNIVHASRRCTPDIESRYRTVRHVTFSDDLPPGEAQDLSAEEWSDPDDVVYAGNVEDPGIHSGNVIGKNDLTLLTPQDQTEPRYYEENPVNANTELNLCIPNLNRVGWDAFQLAGERELFRKTKFHAIDVLEGEPLIKLRFNSQKRRKRQNFAPKKVSSGSTILNTASQDMNAPKASDQGKRTLPERIRINSPVIIKVFAEICRTKISKPFLVFRPFRCLLYFEQEFRDIIHKQQSMLQEWLARNTQTVENVENEIERNALAVLDQMKCLISFIEEELKKKQEYLASNHCQSVPFADVPMLFSPGRVVLSRDHKQAYRVIQVNCTRHRAKDWKEKGNLDFLKDESEVELEDNPVFVHCISLDFDGKLIGPVSRVFMISKYEDEKELTSLPIFPLQHVKEDGLRERLVKRGKAFFKVAGVKHMHYAGLTLKMRDDIDSQVVIDFEEAINRHPHWKPPIASILGESLEDVIERTEIPDASEEDAYLGAFLQAQRAIIKSCIKECCADEAAHYDEYVEDRRKEDYIVSQMNGAVPNQIPVTIIPSDFRHITKNNTLTDDDYLIMSYRVFGFVLRSRKWHELDMTHVFEVAALGAGEGFDELVLPPGHGNMVKSMIRQHLRDRNLSSMNREKTDVVRGKGRGLIILLHGVPGVGKTSTAECIADLFRRPLFQITSGDLGTTAKEVEDALEENFSLASRWNSILLIDEADVFLAERTKEDFVRNSLVAVFLRMMEYYAGVLFLTTNRVGVFDEAFTSRIHISLYYPPLDRKSTLQIFQKNWDRIKARYDEVGRVINIDIPEITEFAIDYFENNKDGRWNGRQIRNAFQSALALAELDALGTDDFLDESEHNRPVALGRKNFDTVAEAYKGFTSYLKQVYGADFARRARENLWRFDAFGAAKMPNSLNTRLKIAELATPPPPPGQWPGQSHAGYDPRNPQLYYPLQQHHAESYDHPRKRPAYPPTSSLYTYPDPRERRDDRSDAGGPNLPQQRYAENYDQPGQRTAYPPALRPYPYPESGEGRDARPGAGDFDQ